MANPLSRRELFRSGAGIATATGLAGCIVGAPEVRGGVLFVDNPRGETQRVRLRVVESPDEGADTVVGAVYRVPPQHVLQFGNVLEDGSRYRIHARLPNSPPADPVDVSVETCEEGARSESTDVRLRLSRDTIQPVTLGCDRTYQKRPDAKYVEPAEYEVSELTPTGSG